MKKTLRIILFLLGSFPFSWAQTFTWNPEFFNEDESATLTVADFDPQATWREQDIYLWAWHWQADGTQINNPTATGSDFSNSPETAKFTNNGDGTYTFDFGVIQDFFDNTDIATIGFLIKSQDGSNQSGDQRKAVGNFQLTLISPRESSLVTSGTELAIAARTTLAADFELYANDILVNSQAGTDTYLFDFTVAQNTSFRLEATNGEETVSQNFQATVIPVVVEETLPAGLKDGINYDPNDATTATLVLSAPGKEFVEVAGSFNNYAPSAADVMKRDPATGKFWLQLTGLTAEQTETYQYWVYDTDPISGSPVLVKTADPFSTLVLSPFDDPGIPSTTYPNLPDYPEGQQREVTVLQTGQTPYPWVVPDFEKPKQEDLIVYEVLVRDFDANRNYQDLIDRFDYFKNLNINAIHLMPVMEFEGNESWGYNTSFHMALDKFYGTADKLKEFIDLCHQNGIAVILDVVLNHAFGRNPMVRMWMDDPDGDGWGGPAADNPYFNQLPRHAFNVGNDFNHQQELTQEYTRRVIEHWITEFHIDGFRWDLTKGFTQNCGNGTFDGDFDCTQRLQQDRIDVLREYADYSWELDESHYVIFEHLGTDEEERQWADYRIDEGKGIMLWGKMTDQYNELTMAQDGNKNINRMGHLSRGFQAPRVLGYAESHDEERLMFKNLEFGNSANSDHNVKNLNTALSRMPALGAVSVMVPGPKMIWHFGSLGMENSIFTCTNATVNLPGGNDGDCKLDTKPQPQWSEDWLGDSTRREIYDTWARLHQLKIEEPVFEGNYTISSGNFTPVIMIWDETIPNGELNHVVIAANFDVTTQSVSLDFPNTGTWYSLFQRNKPVEVVTASTSIEIAPGQFIMLGNVPIIDATDLDSDGIGNDIDDCPDTPLGAIVDVSGCEIFSLPSNNFAISGTGESCRSANDGSINVAVNTLLGYNVTVNGPSGFTAQDSFSGDSWQLPNLTAGEYQICFSVAGVNDYQQCFDLALSEPQALSALSKVDHETKSISLELQGSRAYTIKVNENIYHTEQQQITLPLDKVENSIEVFGEKGCQGTHVETVVLSTEILVYPNPTIENGLKVYLGSIDEFATVNAEIFDLTGAKVFGGQLEVENGFIFIDTAQLTPGTYILTISDSAVLLNQKIIKQ